MKGRWTLGPGLWVEALGPALLAPRGRLPRGRWRRLAPLAALALVLAGCPGKKAGPGERCETEADCQEGLICFEDGCGPGLDFAVRVIPPQSNDYATQDFNPVSVRTSRLDLVLRAPGLVGGTTRVRRGGTVEGYPGAFTVRGRGTSHVIPGLAFEQPLNFTVAAGPDFQVPVPAGLWKLTLTAADATLPPLSAQKLVTSNDPAPGADVTLAVVNPEFVLDADTSLTLTGRVAKTADDPAWPAPPEAPVFRVQAFDPLTGTAISQPQAFPAAAEFSVCASNTGGELLLRVSPDPTTPEGVLAPTVEFTAAPGAFPQPLVLGDWGEPLELRGKILDGSGTTRIPNASIQIHGKVLGGGTFTTTTRSQLDGSFRVKVLPNAPAGDAPASSAYTVTVTPPASSAWAQSSAEHLVRAGDASEHEILCPPKEPLSGSVQTPDGDGMEGIVVHYESNPSASRPGASRGDTITDHEGNFSVLVEPGAYRVVAKPDYTRGRPWAARLAEVGSPVTIILSDAREVVGTVTVPRRATPDAEPVGEPVPNALVSLYRPPTTDGAPPLLLYEGLTDSTGQFRILVPQTAEE